MNEKCPKCSATIANCGPNVWSCGTARPPKGILHESKNCLRRQLARRDITVGCLQAALRAAVRSPKGIVPLGFETEYAAAEAAREAKK